MSFHNFKAMEISKMEKKSNISYVDEKAVDMKKLAQAVGIDDVKKLGPDDFSSLLMQIINQHELGQRHPLMFDTAVCFIGAAVIMLAPFRKVEDETDTFADRALFVHHEILTDSQKRLAGLIDHLVGQDDVYGMIKQVLKDRESPLDGTDNG